MTGTKTTKERLKPWPKNRNKIRNELFCQCPHCPTYLTEIKETGAAKNTKAVSDTLSHLSMGPGQPLEDTYCLMGMSFHDIEREEVCLCPTCMVQRDLDFHHIYYCMRGCEKARCYDEGQGKSPKGSR